MTVWLFVTGVLLLALTHYDALHTTVARGGGPLTQSVSWLVRRLPIPHPGNVVLLTVIALWATLLWTGWALVFLSPDGGIVSASTGEPANASSRVYFAGYTLVTLGLGDFQPEGAVWQILTTLAALSGLFVLTLSISYVLPVLQAAVARRAAAAALWSLGETPEDVVRTLWDGEGISSAGSSHLTAIGPTLMLLAQQHIAYPLLHHYHGLRRREAFAPSLAAFDEALSILEHALGVSVPAAAFKPARSGVAALLDRLDGQMIEPADEAPPIPSLDALRRDGFPVCSDEAFREALAEETCASRRRLLLGLVRAEARTWDDVLNATDDPADGVEC